MRKWLMTLLLLMLSAVLTHWIPFSSFFRNLDTLVHESGHAAVTLILSGNVTYIHLFQDHSGVTLSSVSSGWSMIVVALAGYMTASMFTVYLFFAYSREKERQGLLTITGISVLGLFFINNSFGVTWLIGFIVINVLAVWIFPRFVRNAYFLLLAFLTLEESVFGPITLLILAITQPQQSGDAAVLSHVTGIAPAVWALWFTSFALWSAKLAIQYFFARGTRASRRRKPTVQSNM